MSPTDSLQDIKLGFLGVLAADTGLRSALHASIVDPRIYWFFQPAGADLIDAAGVGGYIVYSLLGNPELRAGVGAPVFKFQIWARDLETAEAARDRLFALFNKQIFTTPGNLKVFCKCVQENDEFEPHDNFAGKTVHVRIGWLTA